ncbi:MAG: preprotein translocase subunit SecG [Candidatus Portnoybacteria bacterium]|nr:preprotein translocase subunit SecG [Candidatus Portnoybacteria bacterium]
MATYLTIAQVIVSITLITSILLQKQGTDVGGIFGGRQESYYSRRGLEKILFFATIALSVFFLGLGVANLLV